MYGSADYFVGGVAYSDDIEAGGYADLLVIGRAFACIDANACKVKDFDGLVGGIFDDDCATLDAHG